MNIKRATLPAYLITRVANNGYPFSVSKKGLMNMDINQWNHLEVGDIVQNVATGESYVITIIIDTNNKRSYFGMRTQSMTNAAEWEQVGRIIPI